MRSVLLIAAAVTCCCAGAAIGQSARQPAAEQGGVSFPPFPIPALDGGAQASCRAFFDVTAAGGTDNVCVVCLVDGPELDVQSRVELERMFVESAVGFVRQRLYEPAAEATQGEIIELNFDQPEVDRPLPRFPPAVRCMSDN